METFTLNVQQRTEFGKGASRRLRRTGLIPATMYGAKKDPISLTLSHDDLLKQLEHEGFYSHILTINIEGEDEQSEKAVLKELQRHPSRPWVMHVDFQRISETEKLYMRIPLHFTNEDKCLGIKQSGGVVSHHVTEVEIRCLPKDLPEFIEVDLETIKINQILHLSDLTLPEGTELASSATDTSHDLPVVSVHLPRGTHTEEENQEETSEEQG